MIRLALTLGMLALVAAAAPAAGQSRGAPPVEIHADELVARGTEAVFRGGVRVTQGPYVLTAERLVVTYGADRQVRTLVAEGPVRVVQGERVVTARRAELDNPRRVLTLTGDPALTEGASVVRGERVVFDLRTDEVRVGQVRAKVKVDALRRAAEEADGGAP